MVGSLRTLAREVGERAHLWQTEGGRDRSDPIFSARKERDWIFHLQILTKLLKLPTPRNELEVVVIIWSRFLQRNNDDSRVQSVQEPHRYEENDENVT